MEAGVLLSAIETTLAVTTFLVGFASLRLHAHRDRALQRSDRISRDLTEASRLNRPVDDEQILETESALSEASRLDTVTRWTLALSAGVAVIALALGAVAAELEGWRFSLNPAGWATGFTAAFALLVIEIAVVGLGIADYKWVAGDFHRRIAGSLMGQVRAALTAYSDKRYEEALSLAVGLSTRLPLSPWLCAFRSQCLDRLGRAQDAVVAARRAVDLESDRGWWRLQLGRALIHAGDHESAIGELTKTLDRLPGEPTALALRGLALDRIGKRDDALADFDSALASNPADPIAREARVSVLLSADEPHDLTMTFVNLVTEDRRQILAQTLEARARRRLSDDDIRRAEEDLSELVSRQPTSAEAYALRGICRARSGRGNEAHADFARALTLNAESVRVHIYVATGHRFLGEIDKSIASFSVALQLSPGNRAALVGRANVLAEAKEFARAAADFTQILTLNPGDAMSRVHRALALAQMGNTGDAIEDVNRVLQESPGDAHALSSRARIRISMEQPLEAITDLDRAIEIEGPTVPDLYARALAKARLGEEEDALKDIQSLFAEDADYAPAFGLRAQLLHGLDRPREALADYDRALESLGNEASLLASRGAAKKSLGLYEEALIDLEAAAELEPGDAQILITLGCTKVDLGRFADAMEDYQRILEFQPYNSSALEHRATAFEQLERDPEALADYELCLRIDSENHRARGRRAAVLLRMDRVTEAMQDLENVLAIADQSTLFDIGASLNNRGHFRESQQVFDRALEHGRKLDIVLARGIAASQQGRPDEAAQYFEEVVRESEDPLALFASMTSPAILREYETVLADWSRALAQRSSE